MPSVLIVDDEPFDRELAVRCLASLPDLRTQLAGDGEAALEAIAAAAPDLVLTDLRLPGMDGIDLVAQVRARHPLIPVILMTSRGSEQIALNALKAGAASYVPKRDLGVELSHTVAQVLEMAEARRTRRAVLNYLGHSESRFVLANDPALIPALVGFLQEGLERIDFGDDAVRTQIGVALMEALSNGMIHGNLEIGSELRRHDLGAYYALIHARRREPPFAARQLTCTARETTREVEYTVADEGPGFDAARLPQAATPDTILETSGRGIFLIRTFMDRVEFNARGNCITLAKRR
ncbi:MAG TPA: response regulator [Candidatus Polarisedimenticolaceae bacterium]|nr:response regulator [Candidatus Polarisedimenticolaceae bacterium]